MGRFGFHTPKTSHQWLWCSWCRGHCLCSPRLSFLKDPFPVAVPVKILKALLPSSILATWPSHLNLLHLTTLTILGERYNLCIWKFGFQTAHRYVVILLLRETIIFWILIWTGVQLYELIYTAAPSKQIRQS